MMQIVLTQFGNSYGGQSALPLSVGCLWAYARTQPEIQTAYGEPLFLYKKEAVSKVVSKIDKPSTVVAMSSYIWNWKFNRALAKAVKEIFPSTLIVYGGVHIPDEPTEQWFDDHPECDFLLHGEGELSFTVFLQELADKRDWSRVPGLSCRGLHTERKFPPISDLRSPYLDGIFDGLLNQEQSWTALQETDRGCPFFCTFCEWGSASLNKIRPFPMDRVLEEIDWFGKHKVEYIEGANANFGILPRDVQIAEQLARTKEKYGYPQKYRAAFAKYSNTRITEQVFTIARILNKSGQLKAVTLALQSTDDNVLEAIDRKNISMSGFADLQKKYQSEGIPTYIELIIGLPGESYTTFKQGLDKVLDAGGHSGIAIYNCVVLPNSEMGKREYIEQYSIQTVPMRAMLLHGTPNPETPDEEQETVIATGAMPHEDWKRAFMLSWIIQTLHTTGLTQWWAKHERCNGLPYTRFYEDLLTFAQRHTDTVLAQVWQHTLTLLLGAIQGGSWDNVLPLFGDVSWPPDEGGFLLITQELDKFYSEMEYLAHMPHEQRGHGPPAIPQGKEQDYARLFWFNRKGDLNKILKDFCSQEGDRQR